MNTPGATKVVALSPDDVLATRRVPSWVLVGLMALAISALWLVAFDNGQASAALDSSGTVLHELFHDGRHLLGAPCH